MGTFSVRSLRADIQNVAMRKNRALPSLMSFMACYLCACTAVYLYFRYYLMNETEYGTPLPASVADNKIFRPFESFSSKKVAESRSNIFEKLYMHRILKRPGAIDELRWYKLGNDTTPRLLKQSQDSSKLQSDSSNENPPEKGDSLTSSIIKFSFTNSRNNVGRIGDFNTRENDNLSAGNSTGTKANTSNVALTREDSNFDLNMVEVISKPQVIFNSSIISRRFQDFRREWFRQRRARVDWERIIKPCGDNMAWGLVKNHWGKGNRSSGRASEVVYWDIRPAGEFSKILIQSKTVDNRTKRIGGDSWRVYARGPSSVAATVFDHQNGTYEAVFLLMEPGIYQLMIYLDYSLCDGFKDPPRDWFIKGNAQGKYQKEGLLGALDDYLKQPFKNGNPLIITVPEAQFNTSFTGR